MPPLPLLPNFGLMGCLDIRGYISLEHEHEGGECFKSESVSAIMTGQMTKMTETWQKDRNMHQVKINCPLFHLRILI